MKITWKEYKWYLVGSIPSLLGGRIVAEIIINESPIRAQMYHSILASDTLNKKTGFDNIEKAKEWCQNEMDNW